MFKIPAQNDKCIFIIPVDQIYLVEFEVLAFFVCVLRLEGEIEGHFKLNLFTRLVSQHKIIC
jgi:hypothetical protein